MVSGHHSEPPQPGRAFAFPGAHMIEIRNLSKRFPTRAGEIVAVDNLSLRIPDGQIFGFLGPNGAGKTTTIRMLPACSAPPAAPPASTAWWSAKMIRPSAPHRVVTETPGFYDTLSAQQNLALFGRLHLLADVPKRTHKYLEMLGLWDRRLDPVGGFSKGMKQKLAIARATLHDPPVLFFDEPTSGLDPDIAKLIRDFILHLKAGGRTIFLCTHNLDEADRLCEPGGCFKNRLVTASTPVNLRQSLFGREQVFTLRWLEADWVRAVYELPFVTEARAEDNRLYVRVERPEEHIPLIVRALVGLGGNLQYVTEQTHSLEEIYLQLINKAEPS